MTNRSGFASPKDHAPIGEIGGVLHGVPVHRIGVAMLDRVLGAAERDQELELLRGIGALFARVTRGAYCRVQTERDDKGAA